MKALFAIVLLLALHYSTGAFSQVQGGIGFIGGLPRGEFNNLTDFGAGAYLELKFAVSAKLDLGLFVSAISFADSDFSGTSSTDPTFIIPVLFTGDYKFLETKWTPYVGLGIGAYIINDEIVDEIKIGVVPKIGVLFGSLSLGLGYNFVSNFNFISFQIGYLSR